MIEKRIRINQIKINVQKCVENGSYLDKAVCKSVNEIFKFKAFKGLVKGGLNPAYVHYEIVKRSVDSRYKPDIYYIYSVDILSIDGVDIKNIINRIEKGDIRIKDVSVVNNSIYEFPMPQDTNVSHYDKPIVVAGFGPAGMFAALKLVRAGFKPVVYERGECVEERTHTVKEFWETGKLNVESNVQFGEGGAGTFSDGKLNTMIKDPTGRIREVLKELVNFGADPSILYVNKPHIGTDVLAKVVRNIREFIIANGGEVHFNSKITELITEKSKLKAVKVVDIRTKEIKEVCCEALCLSVGHSARDTFEGLYNRGDVTMEPKAFAVGLRIEHPQELIDYNAYGDCDYNMPAADYKVTYKTSKGRGVYSFCMCPGGFVVNASSEKGMLAVNGMSYSRRDSANANSALIVTVTPEDYGNGVLDGVRFQRELEQKAYNAANGAVVTQLLKDFKEGVSSTNLGRVIPCIKGRYELGDLNKVLPEFVSEAIKEGVEHFGKLINGFDMDDAVFSGVESRTSSPLRIVRDEETLQSSIKGLYPCGEGAGYAGGITSAAVDGIKVAEKIAEC